MASNKNSEIFLVGEPIPVEKRENPSEAQVDDLHQIYMDRLRKLYDDYKPQFGKADIKLVFLW